MSDQQMPLTEAKERLDRLIWKSRVLFYKPIGVAETLRHNRLNNNPDLSVLAEFRRASYGWCGEACDELYHKRGVLNSRYWDQLFTADVLPPSAMCVLGEHNRNNSGIVETYIFAHLQDRVVGIRQILDWLQSCAPSAFDLPSFLQRFENDPRYRRSVDKAYEIVVYALFNTITSHLNAEVTLSITPEGDILRDFARFAKLVLGVDETHTEIRQPARLYRVGTANAADAGLDMWANFGPAVQVKHISLAPNDCERICDGMEAEQIIIVCKRTQAKTIEAVLSGVGLAGRIRGIITEVDLTQWYAMACGEKYQRTLGHDLLRAIIKEMALEFPLTQAQMDVFMRDRGYDVSLLTGTWSVQRQPPQAKRRSSRPKKARKQDETT